MRVMSVVANWTHTHVLMLLNIEYFFMHSPCLCFVLYKELPYQRFVFLTTILLYIIV
jgi:hypothetical protein